MLKYLPGFFLLWVTQRRPFRKRSGRRFDPLSDLRICFLFSLLLCWLLSGCDGRERIALTVDGVRVMAELAATPEQRRQGLMGRSELGPDQGMLLLFPAPDMLKIWMLNTNIPLDAGFFDGEGKLVNTHSMQPDGGRAIYTSLRPAIYVLEMNLGWYERHALLPGARLQLPFPISAK